MYACRMQHFAIDRLATGCLCHRSDCWKRAVAQSIESMCAHISRRMDIVLSFTFSKLFTNPKWVSIFDAVSIHFFYDHTFRPPLQLPPLPLLLLLWPLELIHLLFVSHFLFQFWAKTKKKTHCFHFVLFGSATRMHVWND